MLRISRPLLRSSTRPIALRIGTPASRATLTCLSPSQTTSGRPNGGSRHCNVPSQLMAFRKTYSTKPPLQPNKIDKEQEKRLGEKKLEAHPELVSATSTVRAAFERAERAKDGSGAIFQDVKADLVRLPVEPPVDGEFQANIVSRTRSKKPSRSRVCPPSRTFSVWQARYRIWPPPSRPSTWVGTYGR